MARRVSFSEQDARRIAAATRAYERGNRDAPAIRWRQPGDDISVRLGKTTATWTKGTTATVDAYDAGSPGSETSSGTIPDCVNKFANIASGKWVMLAQAQNGGWYVIAAECG